MILLIGLFLLLGGLLLGFYGAVSFNFGNMMIGWLIAGVGAVAILTRAAEILVGP